MNYRFILGLCAILPLSIQSKDEQKKEIADAAFRVDIKAKKADCRELVELAIEFFNKNGVDKSCKAFMEDSQFRKGEIMVFVFKEEGECLVFGNQTSVIWRDFKDKTVAVQNDFISEMLAVGSQGGSLSFVWNNAYSEAYVRTVEKKKQKYIIGAGFYPDSAEYTAEQMVKSAITYSKVRSAQEIFERISNSRGIFVRGDIYIRVYDFEGICVADGDNQLLIGQNLLDWKRNDGKFIVRDMLAIAQSKEGKGWYEYASSSGDTLKRTYVERLVDLKTGKEYAVTAGYYPEIVDEKVRSFVKQGVEFLRTNGAARSFPIFSQKRGEFVYGSLSLFVYDMEGVMMADAENPASIGINLMNTRDEEGKYVTRTIIEQAKKYGSGWVSFALKNSYIMMYVEKVTIPDGDFVIGSGYYPAAKYASVRFMVEKAAEQLRDKSKEAALWSFVSGDTDFFRGDLSIFAYTKDAVCLADGPRHQRIWQIDNQAKDAKGRTLADKVIAIATSGGGWIEFEQNRAKRRVFVKSVEKKTGYKNETETFIIGSGYYL